VHPYNFEQFVVASGANLEPAHAAAIELNPGLRVWQVFTYGRSSRMASDVVRTLSRVEL